TVARGKPDDPVASWSLVRFCARLRVRSAPGFPCALCIRGGRNERKTSGASRREVERVCGAKSKLNRFSCKQFHELLLPFNHPRPPADVRTDARCQALRSRRRQSATDDGRRQK